MDVSLYAHKQPYTLLLISRCNTDALTERKKPLPYNKVMV